MRYWILLAALNAAMAFGQTTNRSFSNARQIEIDNVDGTIDVKGYNGREIQVTVKKSVTADDEDKRREAERDVTLEITQEGDRVRYFVDAPWRCRDGCVHIHHRLGYAVRFDFEVQVPVDTELKLKSVNHSRIRVENVAGGYDVNSINGSVEMSDISGSGKVYALNGGVTIKFRRNPSAASSFGSLNGAVDVYFSGDLNADLRMKTFNGGVYTDFATTALPAEAGQSERRDGKFVYRSNRFFGARVGSGGPELKFDAFNGNIRILRRSD